MTGTIAKKKESGPRLQLATGDYTGHSFFFRHRSSSSSIRVLSFF
jgi:hypothetical protein